MIKIKVDNKIINYNNIWYHHQEIPRPGGHKYSIIIDLRCKNLLSVFEKMADRKITDKDFCTEALKQYENSFNLVQWTIDYLDNVEYKKFNIKWVFNNIEKVEIKDNKLIISGTCSEALDDFV